MKNYRQVAWESEQPIRGGHWRVIAPGPHEQAQQSGALYVVIDGLEEREARMLVEAQGRALKG